MSLTVGSFFEADKIGTQETITLQPTGGATATQARIANAFYGQDSLNAPKQVSVAADKLSLTFTVELGFVPLVINVVSPNPNDETISFFQGTTELAEVTVRQHSATCSLFIKGA